MKRLLLVLTSLVLLSSCATKRGSETLVCTWDNEVFKDFTTHTTLIYHAQDSYVTQKETSIRLNKSDELQKRIEADYDGNKERFMEGLSFVYAYYQDEKEQKPVFVEYDTYFEHHEIIDSPQRPSDWRGLVISDDMNISELAKRYEGYSLCK